MRRDDFNETEDVKKLVLKMYFYYVVALTLCEDAHFAFS